MSLEVHLRIEYNELLLQALPVRTHEVILPEVLFQRVVVDIVLLLPAPFSAIADVTALVLVATMRVKLVVSVEALTAESTFRVSLKTALVDRARVVVAEFLMLLEVGEGKELVLVGKHFLVSCTEVAGLG